MKMTNFILIDLTKIVKNDVSNNQNRVANYYNSIGVPIPSDVNSSPLRGVEKEGEVFNYLLHICALKRYFNTNKIWVNPLNGFIIAYEDNEGYKFSENFIDHLLSIQIQTVDNYHLSEIVSSVDELTIDNILDKISMSGIKSLTDEELLFLESNS
jgi:hypothetical protein